jgi:phosphoribosyl 1,2-cyclic phosphodiesterase
MKFIVRFWGTRGTIPCPHPEYMKYGGNTACVEVVMGEYRIILDGGTGIRRLGQALLQNNHREPLTILLSHTHFDHIIGLPFFQPLYEKDWPIRLYAGHLGSKASLRDIFRGMMRSSFFPVSPDAFIAAPQYHDFQVGEVLHLFPEVTVRTFALNHPGGATGYRIEYGGKAFCYLTDVEHQGDTVNPSLARFIADADAVAYDCTFTPEDYLKHQGWGHSTWEAGLRLVNTGGAKRLVIFHHNPDYDDAALDALATDVQQADPSAIISRDGLELIL